MNNPEVTKEKPVRAKFSVLWQTFYGELPLEYKAVGETGYYLHPQARVAIWLEKNQFDSNAWLDNIANEEIPKLNAQGIYVFRLSPEMVDEKWLRMVAQEIETRLNDF